MEKPSIIASGTGAAGVIVRDGQTGLLFENNNSVSLMDKIAFLLENPALIKMLGKNAHLLAREEFSNARTFIKCIDFVKCIAAQSYELEKK